MNTPDNQPRDPTSEAILAYIASLPIGEQENEILRIISMGGKALPDQAILEVEREILAQFPEDIPIVEQALNMLRGQLALRELGRQNGQDWK